jgi:hypothetical protein
VFLKGLLKLNIAGRRLVYSDIQGEFITYPSYSQLNVKDDASSGTSFLVQYCKTAKHIFSIYFLEME